MALPFSPDVSNIESRQEHAKNNPEETLCSHDSRYGHEKESQEDIGDEVCQMTVVGHVWLGQLLVSFHLLKRLAFVNGE